MSQLSSYLPRGLVPVSQQFFYSSRTINFSTSRLGLVMLVGGGGSGASWAASSTYDKRRNIVQGGNAGGCVYQLIRFEAGVDYTFTIGAGGAAFTNNNGNEVDGNNGTNTQLASSALPATIIANGGLGGLAYSTYNNILTPTSASKAHQTQTWGSGGDLIYPGGYGGSITVSAEVPASPALYFSVGTGGGAANVYGVDQDLVTAGNITLGDNYPYYYAIATGGGGIGGNGGNVTRSGVTSGSDWIATGGGGASDAAASYTVTNTTGQTISGAAGSGGMYTPNVLLPFASAGGPGVGKVSASAHASSGYGGGGGGHTTGDGISAAGGDAGRFGGGGAAVQGYNASSAYPDPQGGDGSYGGGGGAAVGNHWNLSGSAQSDAVSGAGGVGIAMLWLFSDFGRVI